MGPLFIGCQWQRLAQQRGEVGSLAKRLNCYHPSSLSPHSLKYTNPQYIYKYEYVNTSILTTLDWILAMRLFVLVSAFLFFILNLCLFFGLVIFTFILSFCHVLSSQFPASFFQFQPPRINQSLLTQHLHQLIREKSCERKITENNVFRGITRRGLRNWSGFGSYLGNFLHCQLLKGGISEHTWASHFQHKFSN